jgi:hypothetical protein
VQHYLPEDKLLEVKRVLHGFNQGAPVASLGLPDKLLEVAKSGDFDLQAYQFRAAAEQLRQPRIVRVGLIQNAVVAPTTAPYGEQYQVRTQATCHIFFWAENIGIISSCARLGNRNLFFCSGLK